MHSPAHQRRGAALLIAVAILAILTVFAVVFSLQSRVDMNAATNFSNNIRADLIADAAVNIAIAFLDHNRDAHPTITSLDQAAFTYFNGTWIAGKWWAFNEPLQPPQPTWVQGRSTIPFIWADEADVLGDTLYIPRKTDLDFSAEPDWDPGDGDDIFNQIDQAFLIDDPDGLVAFRTRMEQIHQINDMYNTSVLFTDVDNNGDGFRDSMWIPIPADQIFGGIDSDADGATDGLDNDGDTFVDEVAIDVDGDGFFNGPFDIPAETNVTVDEGGDGIDNDLDGEIDEPGEIAAFVYWGGNDGRDNDGDLAVDELDERRIFLTAPLVTTNPFGLDAVGIPLLTDGFAVFVNAAVVLEFSNVPFDDSIDPRVEADNLFGTEWETIEYAVDTDLLDNDFDLIANNDAGESFDSVAVDLDGDTIIEAFEITYAAQRAARGLGLNLINTDVGFYDTSFGAVSGSFIAARGEPVCAIAGRVAVLITDESSKVNIDIAGALSPNEHFDATETAIDVTRPTRRALSQAVGTHEYDLRVLPSIGVQKSGRMWNYRMGIPNGQGFGPDLGTSDKVPDALFPEHYDISVPGYGGVDDNMSSLWMAVNGLDDDGDAEVYQNDLIDNNLNNAILTTNGLDDDGDGFVDEIDEGVDEPGEGIEVGVDEGLRPFDYDGDGDNTNDDLSPEYANFEGTDEPGEFQMYRPLRNVVLERTVGDEDEDLSFEEFGEASDRVFHARDQLLDVTGIGPVINERLRPLVTAHSQDGGGRYQYYSRIDGSPLERPLLNGLKLNPNYMMGVNPNNADDPGQLARMYFEDWYYPPSTEDAQFVDPFVDLIADIRGQVGTGELTEAQRSFLTGMRQEDVFLRGVPFFDGVLPGATATAGPMPPDQELRALRLGATLQDFRDVDHVRTESSIRLEDPWWSETFITGASIDDTNGDGIQDFIRQIEYKTSGIESIRINEIMVRPVRRIEAEVATDPTDLVDPVADFNYTALRDANSVFAAAGDLDFDVSVENFETGSPFTVANGIALPGVGSSGWRLQGGGTIGELEAFATDRAVLTDGSGRSDILQFRFRPSTGLPPGRYYLTMNFMDAFGNVPQALVAGDIEYAIKYVTPTGAAWPGLAAVAFQKTSGATDILTDDHNQNVAAGPLVPWSTLVGLSPAIIGVANNPTQSRKTGWAFLPSNPSPNIPVLGFAGYGQNGAFTVEIPPFVGGPNPVQIELCVAVRLSAAAGVASLSVNFFDFSQEPDHEYIEIVNIEEPPANLSGANVDLHSIDVSGWQIEVGDSVTNSNAAIMTIPPDTFIAPGENLLLAVNKFDIGIDGDGQTLFSDLTPGIAAEFDIFKNGIGLARGPLASTGTGTTNAFGWVTEPAIPTIDPVLSAAAGWNVPRGDNGNDVLAPIAPANIVGAGVFFRPFDRDIIDNNGDGIDDFDIDSDEPLANQAQSTTDVERNVVGYIPTAFGVAQQIPTNRAKAWDRIVQLILPEDMEFDTGTAAAIAPFILNGGVFPNYPELDGVDNDGDNGFLTNDSIDNDGDHDPNDGIDADNDGVFVDVEIDQLPPFEIDDDNDGFVDEAAGEGSGFDEEFEGYDEGYVRRYEGYVASAGSYDDDIVLFTDIFGPEPANITTGQPDYVSNVGESPDWKAFVERRFYPGDNVIVTLYDGPVGGGRVVDRVTYNQRDIENVAIDDDVDVPAALVYNPALLQAWPLNTMGLDFYRSLERKHPLYAGDRFGTRNRWTATDGNYDDWSRGTNRFDELLVDEFGADPQTNAVVSHGLSGSPLRMNFYQRVLENPNDQFPNAAPAPANDNRWIYARAKVRNKNLPSSGDLMTLSHMSFAHDLYEIGVSGIFDTAFEATPNFSSLAQEIGVGPLVGMDFPKDLKALVTSTSFDEVNLSVGQADFYPIYPTVDHVDTNNAWTQWGEVGGLTVPPRAWSPVFVYPLDSEVGVFVDDLVTVPTPETPFDPTLGTEELFSHLFLPVSQNYPFHPYFMFQPASDIGKVPVGTDELSMFDRWPLDRRAVAYVSANPSDFVVNLTSHDSLALPAIDNEHPSEALFVWQGEDALQNGRYDAYVVTMDNLDDIAAAHEDSLNAVPPVSLLTAVGAETVGAMVDRNPEEFGVDIAFLTDFNGDRRCWTETNANGLPDRTAAANEINFDTSNPESYGRLDGMTPSRDGIIYYGAVEVKNNYLALFIRNWAVSGVVNRVTRVVLTPRRATSGRINVNTAVTRLTDNGELFNPLMGIPGLLYNDDAESITLNNDTAIDLQNGYSGAPADGSILLDRADGIIRYRQERGVKSGVYSDAERVIPSPINLLDGFQVGFLTENETSYPRSLFSDVSGPVLADDADLTEFGELRFIEMQARMSLLSNFVTTRSDVFEILVTAQPGYVSDNNADGVLNWRDDNEFVATGEIKRRVIYERSQGDPDAARNN